ncbi:hypothetical protein [Nonomuraea rhizosphaerae]|uniref:hypothetical protein n=1 Tax=Nonomuraea rhizosphaerae TaxID=2665663 RepID=UPI001C5F99A9|nr:hypothetical protein [Nonomuraea rhizosphaerae]
MTEREFAVDQTNHSVVVDERVVVKWLTPPAAMPHPTPEMWAHLVAAGFACTAPPYAALTRAQDGGETLLALVTGYLPEATDGWEWGVDEAASGRTGFAVPLGRLAGELHLALSTFLSSSIVTSDASVTGSCKRSVIDTLRGRADRALDEALALTGGQDGAWLAEHEPVLRAELAPLAGRTGSPLIRVHGDLHIGQILRWRDGYAVIDFDGNPTVADADPYQPAARDVAQLATSLEHVAQVAVKRRGTPPGDALRWAAETRRLLLAAYRDRLAEGGRPDLLDESLLRPFEIEQECRELLYAARHLPRWRYAPMGVLRTRYPEETP